MTVVALRLAHTMSVATEEETYIGYSYSYPHKSAYGPLEPSVSLKQVWQAERRDALFLYVHIPYCEMHAALQSVYPQRRRRNRSGRLSRSL